MSNTSLALSKGWEYDSADRSTTGYTLDAFGRTTVAPAGDMPTGAVDSQMTYHVNDMVRSITQGPRASTYTLDALTDRYRSWTENASGTSVTHRNHYGDDGDNPSWTEEGNGNFSRGILGLSGMIGTFASSTAPVWVVTNHPGDHVAGMVESLTGACLHQ
ncbi:MULTISPECIES: hypothetical protein [Micromonospora]|uniref:hypothetical protein n=1 Tax=Micromonospora TaxID=1873 RepID=UPI0033D5EDEB